MKNSKTLKMIATLFIALLISTFMTGCTLEDLKNKILDTYNDVIGTELWPNGEVFYTFKDSMDADKRAIVRDQMDKIENATKCVYFIEVPLDESNSQDDVYIGCKDDDTTSSEASIGKRHYNFVILSHNTFTYKYMIVHELYHVLGFYHEHQRPDRDDYINVNFQNIRTGYSINFIKLNADNYLYDINNFEYDSKSIMQYSSNSFSVKYNDPEFFTMTKIDGSEIEVNTVQSPTDILKVQAMYGQND